jgi:hypothetical protein
VKIPILMTLAALFVAAAVARQVFVFRIMLPLLRRHGHTVRIPIVPLAVYRELCRKHGYSERGLTIYLWLLAVECLLLVGWISVAALMPGRVL